MASASCDPSEADILEAREHCKLVVQKIVDAITDDDDSDAADYSTGGCSMFWFCNDAA